MKQTERSENWSFAVIYQFHLTHKLLNGPHREHAAYQQLQVITKRQQLRSTRVFLYTAVALMQIEFEDWLINYYISTCVSTNADLFQGYIKSDRGTLLL